ncbi:MULTISPECIES: histidinol-phosphatase [unclassified Variovorax]|uniref:histidinol-phosphatase n=1 Tax=unclassified Variovorax TaxID=663243 RepID=UPI00076D10FA|nr:MULTISPECIES: histidinol-phosphatase [unclassified Variovorax]KWT94208.1 putative inositol monophosphatase protein [Variovorax sp. WDL1]PNG59835.1 Histidinol-phosphatase [Variovorax sp. B4]PNG60374.1 Histidinol-phosphatase [Variovorax sp. B2]VTV13766.1 Histidinol-phosphatase [Variovorax sp. WDL1]
MSSTVSPQDALRIANALADAAAAHSLRLFRTPLEVIAKADESPVTMADRAAEAAMREILGAQRPADGIFGEEHGLERVDAADVWVLDPIDGTRSFITGSPLWGTLIGLVRGGRVELGMVDMPVLGERWVGQAGLGAQRNGQPVRVSACGSVEAARIFTTSPDIFAPADWEAFDRLSRRCAMRRFGGDCYSYAQLAGGSIDLVVETGLQPYDYLAPAGLIEAAGGVITDWEGRPLGLASNGRVVAAATPALHREALAILNA